MRSGSGSGVLAVEVTDLDPTLTVDNSGATVLETLYAAEDILADESTKHRDHVLIFQRLNAINNRGCP